MFSGVGLCCFDGGVMYVWENAGICPGVLYPFE